MACRLGSTIILPPPPPPAMLAHVPDQIRALPSGSGHSAAGLRSASPPVSWSETPPLALPRISPPCFPAAASSTNRNATRATSALGRTPPHSPHSASVRKSTCATSSMYFCFVFVASLRNFAMRPPSSARCASRSAHRTPTSGEVDKTISARHKNRSARIVVPMQTLKLSQTFAAICLALFSS